MPNLPSQEEWVQYLKGGNNPLEQTPIVELSTAPLTVASARGGTATAPGTQAPATTGGATSGVGTPTTTQGTAAIPTGGSVLSSGATSQTPAASAQGAVAAPAQAQQRPLDPGVLFPERQYLYGTQGNTIQRLFAPGEEAKQRVTGFTQKASEAFSKAAGPTGQTFESRGGAGTLGKYVSSGEGLEPAKGLLSTTYTGPKELSEVAETQKAQDAAYQEMTRRSAMRTGGGLMALLTSAVPGLTPGMAKFEAQQVFEEPGYRQRAAKEEESAGDMLSRLAAEEQKARDIAAMRANEELAIQSKARDWLQGRRTGVLGDIESRVAAELARRKKMEDAVTRYAETGDPSYLISAGFDWDTAATVSPYAADLAREKEVFQRLQEKYPTASSYPALEKRITGLGNEGWGADWLADLLGSAVKAGPGQGAGVPLDVPSIYGRTADYANVPTSARSETAPTQTAGEVLAKAAANTGASTPYSMNVLRGAISPASVIGNAISGIRQAAARTSTPSPTPSVENVLTPTVTSKTSQPFMGTGKAIGSNVNSVLQSVAKRIGDAIAINPATNPTLPEPTAPEGGYTDIDITGGRGPEDIRNYRDRLGTDYTDLVNLYTAIDARYKPGGQGAAFYEPYFAEEAGISPWYEPGVFGPEYVSYEPGTEASTANMAEQQEVDMLNRIAELLELQEVAARSEIPYAAPSIKQNAAAYKAAEEQRMAERMGRKNQVWDLWGAMLKAKEDEEEAKKFGNKLASTASSVFTLGL